MNRSEVNEIIREADAFLTEHRFHLPPFAYWSPVDWRSKGEEMEEIVARRLGWDITDFGSGDFRNTGLFLFTLRNGDPKELGSGRGKLYAEKILIVQPDQLTPMHLHKVKTEDIINRGGGGLAIKLYNATDDGDLDDSDVIVNVDGVMRTVSPGAIVRLDPGESITLTDGLYHEFWAMEERVLVGEVSLVNDDATDNYFYEDIGRFPVIEEDEEPLHLLVNDYEDYVSFAA